MCEVEAVWQCTAKFEKGEQLWTNKQLLARVVNDAGVPKIELVQQPGGCLATLRGGTIWTAQSVAGAVSGPMQGDCGPCIVEFKGGTDAVSQLRGCYEFENRTNAGSASDYFFQYARLDQQQNMLMDTVSCLRSTAGSPNTA